MLELWDAGIECRTLYNSIPNNTYLSPGEFFNKALHYSNNYYFVPIHQNLSVKNLDYIISKIK